MFFATALGEVTACPCCDWLHHCSAETVLSLMRSPEYCIYGAAKVDNARDLDAGEDRFNEVCVSLHPFQLLCACKYCVSFVVSFDVISSCFQKQL